MESSFDSVCGAWECRFSPNRKKRFLISEQQTNKRINGPHFLDRAKEKSPSVEGLRAWRLRTDSDTPFCWPNRRLEVGHLLHGWPRLYLYLGCLQGRRRFELDICISYFEMTLCQRNRNSANFSSLFYFWKNGSVRMVIFYRCFFILAV